MIALVFVAAVLTTLAAPAGDRLAGTWRADVRAEGKSFSLIFNFAVNGDQLTGTVELPSRDQEFEITDGKIRGNEISFKAIGIWRGTLAGKELELTRELDYGK